MHNLAPIAMIMDKQCNMYYIQTSEGHCAIKQIVPFNDMNHIQIYDIKSQCCFGFNIGPNNNIFYFIDEYKIVNKLIRTKETKKLVESEELYIKEKDRTSFIRSKMFMPVIFNDKYII